MYQYLSVTINTHFANNFISWKLFLP